MVKVSDQLASEFKEVYKEVNTWESWKRSLDPQGADSRQRESKSESENASKCKKS